MKIHVHVIPIFHAVFNKTDSMKGTRVLVAK